MGKGCIPGCWVLKCWQHCGCRSCQPGCEWHHLWFAYHHHYMTLMLKLACITLPQPYNNTTDPFRLMETQTVEDCMTDFCCRSFGLQKPLLTPLSNPPERCQSASLMYSFEMAWKRCLGAGQMHKHLEMSPTLALASAEGRLG